MEEKQNLTIERSLEIIRESIERSQRTINKNAALPLMWWGACVVAFSLLIAYLWKNHGGPAWNLLWVAIWLAGYVGEWMIAKRREDIPTSFVGKTIGHVWATFGVFCCGVGIILGLIGSGIIPMELIMPKMYVFGCITSIISLCSESLLPSWDLSSETASYKFAVSSRASADFLVLCISRGTVNYT